MVLLVKTKKVMKIIEDSVKNKKTKKGRGLEDEEIKKLDKIEPSSTMSAIAKLLPADAIVFFGMVNKYLAIITDPGEIMKVLWIGFFAGIIYTFLSRFLVLLKERDKLEKVIPLWIIILQVLITCGNYMIYYLLQMGALNSFGSAVYVNFLEFVIGTLWLAVIALFSYYLT